MDLAGFDWRPDDRKFVPRKDGPAKGRLVLGVREALGFSDPDYTERTPNLADPNPPTVNWPPWAW
ncbi:MAG: hypothetical protein H0W81_11930 [Chloroflexi bacterium]|nr:hypothetical protein [Chloroflexota bacterium]